MADFEELGLRGELVRALEDEDLEQPTALQQAVIPVLRRGGNLVAKASTGAGKTLAYTVGVLDHVHGASAAEKNEAEEEEDGSATAGVRVLVLRPTVDSAEATASAIFPYAQAAGLVVSVAGGSWGTPPEAAGIVVGTAATVMEGVRGSVLKLDQVESVVVDGASAMYELGQLEALETLLDNIPRDAQRVLVSAAFPPPVGDLADRRVKRALHFPAEAAVPASRPAEAVGSVGYILVPEVHKFELLARALSTREHGGSAPLLFCRTDERAALLAEQLTVRGFVLGELGDEDADVAIATVGTTRAELAEDAGVEAGQTISFDVPADEETLLARHGGDADAIVLLEPRELPHLRMIADRARLDTRSVTLPIESPAVRQVAAFREQVRQAVQEEDIGAQLLLLEPIFEEFSPAEVAAAVTALLRRRPAPVAAPAGGAGAATPRASREQDAARGPLRARAADAGPAPSTFARLFVGVGSRDGLRAGDLVGAIAGEADIPGSSIGKIDIRDSFSIVEVPADAADRIITAINGTTIKGRSVRVDYDRGADRTRKPPQRRSQRPDAEPRGGTRRTIVRRPPRRD
jgi:ATP-dependent RNA helicase DeaD